MSECHSEGKSRLPLYFTKKMEQKDDWQRFFIGLMYGLGISIFIITVSIGFMVYLK